MFHKTVFCCFIFALATNFYFSQLPQNLKKGFWQANLQLNENTQLPFTLEVGGSKKKPLFTIHNAEEQIQLTDPKSINDSFQIDFPNFHSYLRFVVKNKRTIAGTWTNLNKGNNYKIPFQASFGLMGMSSNFYPTDISGRWKTAFSPGTTDQEMAVGVFKSGKSFYSLTGTFLTETGDYRFLEGKSFGNNMYLSCFDGSHAFYFSGRVQGDSTITGEFFSGKHYKTTWKASRDSLFQLRDPDSVTYLVKKETFNFKLKDLDGKDFSFPNERYQNKVVIVQIMGTWCPNCLDETRFLKEMFDKYGKEGLEIISVGYETPAVFEEQVQKINLLKSRLDLHFQFLVGGQANKALASEQFSMLNQIVSYPTAIFINRKGEVVKIHTGFNGPGTGQIYLDFKKETEQFIQGLLKP